MMQHVLEWHQRRTRTERSARETRCRRHVHAKITPRHFRRQLERRMRTGPSANRRTPQTDKEGGWLAGEALWVPLLLPISRHGVPQRRKEPVLDLSLFVTLDRRYWISRNIACAKFITEQHVNSCHCSDPLLRLAAVRVHVVLAEDVGNALCGQHVIMSLLPSNTLPEFRALLAHAGR